MAREREEDDANTESAHWAVAAHQLSDFKTSWRLQALGQHGIGVSAVAPGFIETDMAKAVLQGPQGDTIRSQSSWGRVGLPCEVADAVFFLASSGAGWCSGTVLDCNGASYLH